MSTHNQSRVQAGVSTGGQYSTGARGESEVSLAGGPRQLEEVRRGVFKRG